MKDTLQVNLDQRKEEPKLPFGNLKQVKFLYFKLSLHLNYTS